MASPFYCDVIYVLKLTIENLYITGALGFYVPKVTIENVLKVLIVANHIFVVNKFLPRPTVTSV